MRHSAYVVGALVAAGAAVSLIHCVGDSPAISDTTDSGTDGPRNQGADGAAGVDSGMAADTGAGGTDAGGGGDAGDSGLAPLTIVPSIATGFGLTCTNRPNGRVYCWGSNSTGQLGNLQVSATPTPSPVQVAFLTNAARVVTTLSSACALLTDHTVWCWGDNASGQLGHPIAADSPNTYSSTPTKVPALSDVIELSAGGSFVCARKADKSVWCWGGNGQDQLGHDKAGDPACGGAVPCSAAPTQVPALSADQLAVGFAHACARVGTTAFCWGDNEYAQLGHLLGQGGDVSGLNPTPTQALATNVAALFAGGGYVTCMLDQTSTVSCWGEGASGQLGDHGVLATSAAPVPIAGLAKTATKARPSFTNACATMGSLGGVWCWGPNNEGGDGVPDADSYPRAAGPVSSLPVSTYSDIAGGFATDEWCAIDNANDVWCWGINISDQLGHSNTTDTTCGGQKCSVVATKVQGLP